MLIAHAGTAHIFDRGKVAADDLHLGSVAAGIVIGDGKANHIDAHVRRALVGALAQDLFHQGTDYREGLDVAVVVDRGLVVGLKVEGGMLAAEIIQAVRKYEPRVTITGISFTESMDGKLEPRIEVRLNGIKESS